MCKQTQTHTHTHTHGERKRRGEVGEDRRKKTKAPCLINDWMDYSGVGKHLYTQCHIQWLHCDHVHTATVHWNVMIQLHAIKSAACTTWEPVTFSIYQLFSTIRKQFTETSQCNGSKSSLVWWNALELHPCMSYWLQLRLTPHQAAFKFICVPDCHAKVIRWALQELNNNKME